MLDSNHPDSESSLSNQPGTDEGCLRLLFAEGGKTAAEAGLHLGAPDDLRGLLSHGLRCEGGRHGGAA